MFKVRLLIDAISWRLAHTVHRRSGVLPPALRRNIRRGMRVAWWTLTFQLPARLRARRAALSDAAAEQHHPAALPVFAAPHTGGRRLTVVTDSINAGSLYGGVGTALILAALAARRIDAALRIVTRTEAPDVAKANEILGANRIPWDRNIEFVFASGDGALGSRDVPVAAGDLFLTTSWWTTRATCQSVPRNRIACLVQEDERAFYPFGDEHLRCTETLSDPDLLYLVNSGLLLSHLNDDGLAPGGTAFEPAFPAHLYYPAEPDQGQAGGKHSFFFYARPNHIRNLYWRGLEALSTAIEEGILDPREWSFHFAGYASREPSLPRGVRPILCGPMTWPDYAAFIRRMDVGLSLMYTPHPSYPPLDLAASGGVAVTNRFGRKRSLEQYSRNIVCADLDVPSLVDALRRAGALAADKAARRANFAASGLQRDWAASMAPAIHRLAVLAEA